MTEQEYKKEEFRNLGFRCIETTQVRFLDGSVARVTAYGYQSSNEKKRPNSTEREKRAWKIYSIVRENQQAIELIDELILEERVGDAFNRLS